MANVFNAYPATRLLLIVLGLGLLAFYHLVEIPYKLQSGFFIASVLISGIPHGSLDHQIHRRTAILEGKKHSKWAFMGFYHKFLLIYAIMWLIHVEFAFLLFILLSAFHFGELDCAWIKGKNRKWLLAISTIYGILLLSNMFLFHIHQILPVLSSFKDLNLMDIQVFENLFPYRLEIFCGSVVTSVGLLVGYQMRHGHSIIRMAFAACQTLILFSLVTQLPVFLGFGFYFSIWHSLLTFQSLKKYVYGSHTSWFELVRSGAGNSIAAILIVGVVVALAVNQLSLEQLITASLFGIAILTAPHMVVISGMFSKQFLGNNKMASA
jgi:Brp/Blh family beta-carotene 15,15'-monooxygenase